MSLTREELRHVERAALAHDIGRVVAPDAPGEAGREVSRGRQAALARDVLAVSPPLQRAARIVGAYCERIDGSGWPSGLSGDEIPVGARIVGVADAYDALMSLCVEMGLSADAIAVELVRHAGTRFDARVVAACLRWMDASPAGVPSRAHSERLM
jgi:response regulator RpfG family c-di-GMP phosphodiesterase